MGVTFLFQVDWLSGLGVIGIFWVFKGGEFFDPPFWNFQKKIYIQNKKLWGVTFFFEVNLVYKL